MRFGIEKVTITKKDNRCKYCFIAGVITGAVIAWLII